MKKNPEKKRLTHSQADLFETESDRLQVWRNVPVFPVTKTCPSNIQRFLSGEKFENFIGKNSDIFDNRFAQDIDYGYT